MSYDVAIVGLGRVGLPLALCFADHGLRVLGIDNDAERLVALRARSAARRSRSSSIPSTRRPWSAKQSANGRPTRPRPTIATS